MKKNKISGVEFSAKGKDQNKFLAAALADHINGSHTLSELSYRVGSKEYSNILLLCQHYSIENGPAMFYQLALELARELYPESKKRGRKTKWTPRKMGVLVAEVERLVKPDNPKYGVSWACKQLAKREPWKSFLESKDGNGISADPGEALRRTYYDFQNNDFAEIMRNSFKKFEQLEGKEQWDKLVIDIVNE